MVPSSGLLGRGFVAPEYTAIPIDNPPRVADIEEHKDAVD
jgi:hypothetical protein